MSAVDSKHSNIEKMLEDDKENLKKERKQKKSLNNYLQKK